MSDAIFTGENQLTPEQVAEKGAEIYEKKLKSALEPEHKGKFVVIDVISSEYFLGDNLLEALENARKKYKDRLFHSVRVGFPGVFKLGTYTKGRLLWMEP